jgi:hypothetical protein
MIFIHILFFIYFILVLIPIYTILSKRELDIIDKIFKILITIVLVPLSIFMMFCFNYLISGIFNVNYLGTMDNNILKKLILVTLGLPSLLIILLNIFLLIIKKFSNRIPPIESIIDPIIASNAGMVLGASTSASTGATSTSNPLSERMNNDTQNISLIKNIYNRFSSFIKN